MSICPYGHGGKTIQQIGAGPQLGTLRYFLCVAVRIDAGGGGKACGSSWTEA